MVPPNETSRQPLASPRACCPGPGTGTWQLVATSDVPAKDGYDARPLAKTATSGKWLYVAVTVLSEHSRWTSCMPQDSESVTKMCVADSMRTAFTAHDQHVVPFLPGNTVELDLTLPRIVNIGSFVTGVPFSSQTSPDSMSLLVTDMWGYARGPVNCMLTATSSNTTDTVVGPWWYGAAFVWTDEQTWWSLMEVR